MSALEGVSSPDVADLGRLLVIPLGATEQHGPHLPVGTDTRIAIELATRLTDHVPDAVIAPAMPYGSSGEHQDFPGTLSIGQEAMELLLIELVRSATQTFPCVLLLSAHGGNAACIARAVRQLRAEGRDVLAWDPAQTWMTDQATVNDAHAGRIETSLMLALAPDQVDMTRARAGSTAPLRTLLPTLVRHGVRTVSENGVLGDPSGASESAGEELLEHAETALVAFVRAWLSVGTF